MPGLLSGSELSRTRVEPNEVSKYFGSIALREWRIPNKPERAMQAM